MYVASGPAQYVQSFTATGVPTPAGLFCEAALEPTDLATAAITGVSDGTITGVCTHVWHRSELTVTEIRIHRVDRFDLSLMVSQWACFHESSVQAHRRLRTQLPPAKKRLYAQMGRAIGWHPPA